MPAHPAPSTAAATPRREDVGERALLRALAAGDRRAGAELVERTYRRVWAAQVRFTGGDADLAADLTQETYRRAWAAIGSFDGRAAFSTWLYRIAYTTFLNHVRRPRRAVPLEGSPAELAPDGGPGGEVAAIRSEESERVRRAVLGLPESLRDTVAARYWGGLPVREIAAAEGLSAVAVRKRLRRAHGLLAAVLEPEVTS